MLDRRELIGLGLAAFPALVSGRWPIDGPAAVAFVTADTEAHVAVVALGARRVVQRVRTVEDPRSIERSPDGRWAVVGHAGAGAISVLDLRERRVRRVLRGFVRPRYTAFAPGGATAYVSDGGAGEVAVVDVPAGRVRRRIAVGDGARHLGLTPDGRRLWVALGSSAAEIAIVDPRRGRRVATVRPPFLAHDVAFSPSGRRAWVTAGREPRIAVFDTSTYALVRTLGADAAPQHVAFGPATAYVASGDGRTVRTHALADGRVVSRARVPSGSYNIQRTGARVLTPSLGTGALTLLTTQGKVIASIGVARNAHDACLG
ncbi:YncE family protein [Baekduia alba]|uniref:YncE family protein n=1 Tax=Baekduia alba TaxID=2997333 RepID=UPI00234186B7|nr:YncE family protein [Baekduia alba]